MQAYKNIIIRFCLTHCNWHCRNKRKPLSIQEPAFSIIHVSFYDFYVRHCHFQPKLKPDAQVPTRNYICVKVHACEKKRPSPLPWHFTRFDLGCLPDLHACCFYRCGCEDSVQDACKKECSRCLLRCKFCSWPMAFSGKGIYI